MRAIRVNAPGGPEALRLEEVPTPQPRTGQVLVRIRAVGVNPVETYIRSGKYGRLPSAPYTPGTDAAGVVEAVGDQVTRVAPGHRVYTAGTLTGAYAEFALCEESQVHLLPERISFEQGAGINIPYATACRALFQKAGATAFETLLVHGASGGVGIAAVQLGRAAGLTVIGTAGTPAGRELVLKEGAHHALDHHDAGFAEKLLELTQRRGAAIILEMLANVNLAKDLQLLAPRGRVVVIGSRGKIEIDPRDAMARDAAVFGMILFNASGPELADIHARLAIGLANGALRPVVGKTFPLGEAPSAHEAILQPGARGKIILLP